MKYKTTQRAVKEGHVRVYAIGYCQAQNLLRFANANAYTSGIYGHNADVYTFGGIALTTGYRPFGERVDYKKVDAYDKLAHKAYTNYDLHYTKRDLLVKKLLQRFVREVLNKSGGVA